MIIEARLRIDFDHWLALVLVPTTWWSTRHFWVEFHHYQQPGYLLQGCWVQCIRNYIGTSAFTHVNYQKFCLNIKVLMADVEAKFFVYKCTEHQPKCWLLADVDEYSFANWVSRNFSICYLSYMSSDRNLWFFLLNTENLLSIFPLFLHKLIN